MLCDMCGHEEAFVWVQQVVGSETVELKLCQTCAKKRGFMTDGDKKDFSVSGLLSGLIDGGEKKHEPMPACPSCGMTQTELRKSGRLGCETCASHFRGDIRVWIRRLGAVPEHRGMYPKSALARETVGDRAGALRDRLRDAVSREDYEAAVNIRDELKALERAGGE